MPFYDENITSEVQNSDFNSCKRFSVSKHTISFLPKLSMVLSILLRFSPLCCEFVILGNGELQ